MMMVVHSLGGLKTVYFIYTVFKEGFRSKGCCWLPTTNKWSNGNGYGLRSVAMEVQYSKERLHSSLRISLPAFTKKSVVSKSMDC